MTVRNCGVDYTFTEAPERVVTPSVPGTELMLALGLESKLAGVVGAVGVLSPDLQPKMAGVNIITERTFPPPSKEAVLSVNPDYVVSGYSEDFAATAIGDRGELKAAGVSSYLVQGKCGDGRATLDDTYADIENLGRVFNVPAQAANLVAKLKSEAATARPAPGSPKVLIYAAGREQPSTHGASTLAADLVARAGGQNIFPEISSFGRFDWETAVERNPDVILVVTTGSFPLTTAEEFLYGYEPVAGVKAVANRRIVSVGVNDVQPGPRNGQALVTIAKGLAGG
ncbi:MAG: ABC transporter substrate-binding protein [Actinomycetota bacterium]